MFLFINYITLQKRDDKYHRSMCVFGVSYLAQVKKAMGT